MERLIDANALMRRICAAECGCEYEDCINEGDCSFDFFIFHAPTIVDVESVRHGRWLQVKSPWNGNVHKCSYCKETIKSLSGQLLYCPNCGAKMDGK